MKINKKMIDNTIEFIDLKIGEVFSHQGIVYMKLPDCRLCIGSDVVHEVVNNATSLSTGTLSTISPKTKVKRLSAELTVTETPYDEYIEEVGL